MEKYKITNEKEHSFLFLIFAGFLVIADQVSKYIIRHSGGFYICNKGIAWGIIPAKEFLWIFFLIISLALFFFLEKHGPKQYLLNFAKKNSFSLVLVFAGAFSNSLDRFFGGCVVDFIDLGFWPVFNLADSFIVLGAFLILVKNFKQ